MKLWQYSGKKIRITTDDGKIFEGMAYDYIPSQDNIPEIASITIEHTEIYENEIKSIEMLS